MTERLYYHDSSLLIFTGKVTDITGIDDRFGVILNKTAFYPTSGGQLFDTGTISGLDVVDVIDKGGSIIHVIEKKPSFKAGDEVEGIISDTRRRDNMQKHTGQHMLSRSFIETCGANTLSARLGEDDSTIDLDCGELDQTDLIRAEDLANNIIFQNRPVEIRFVSEKELNALPLRKSPKRNKSVYRIITIKDYDCSTCGGTHCPATGAVGIIKITGLEKIRQKLRIHFLTGLMALDDYRWRFEQIASISNLFTRHGRESVDGVKSLFETNERLRKRLSDLKKEFLPSLLQKWYDEARDIGGLKVVALDLSDGGDERRDIKEIVLALLKRHQTIAIIICDDRLFAGVSEGLPISAAKIVKSAVEQYGGRGGGSNHFAQGGGFDRDGLKVLIADPGSIIDK